MAYGMVAKNDHGVLLSADQKNYVFTGYYPAPAPSGNLYTFNVAATSLSLYGIRLPVGGQGSVISSVAISGGYRVTVIGTSVTGLLVFSPIAGGGVSGYGFSMFNSAGACTFDSNQKHLVVSSAGAVYSGGSVAGTGDVVIFSGCGIYPSNTANTQTGVYLTRESPIVYNLGRDGYGNQIYTADTFTITGSVRANVTTTTWYVYRPTAYRNAASITASSLLHIQGQYAVVWGVYREVIKRYNLSGSTSTSQEKNYYSVSSSQQAAAIESAQQSGVLSKTNQYPYAASSYNTTQNLALITDSALYL